MSVIHRPNVHGFHRAPHTVTLPDEVAVAITYDGTTQAVLMATPADLVDFAYGFSLTEGIAQPADILEVTPEAVENGIDLRIWLRPDAGQRLITRRRNQIGPVGCGLCGIDTLAEAMRPLPRVIAQGWRISAAQIDDAVAAMETQQPLRDATGATHAAGFYVPGQGLIALREDVGRHNALDKLAGSLVRDHAALIGQGAVVMTSRISVDLVQKTASLGAPALIALAAPTSAAVTAAENAGLALAGRARSAARAEIYHMADCFLLD